MVCTRFKRVSILMLMSISMFIKANQLVNVRTIPNIVIDLRYATENNFTGQKIYPVDACYALDFVVEALARVQQELFEYGLGLKIFDAYRPLSAQWTLWNCTPDKRYVADPRLGGRHTRGTTVDITLINLNTQEEVEMPTEFDNFTEKAWSDSLDATPQALKNRDFLIAIMAKHGFTVLPHEWWHFDYADYESYPVIMDVELEQLS